MIWKLAFLNTTTFNLPRLQVGFIGQATTHPWTYRAAQGQSNTEDPGGDVWWRDRGVVGEAVTWREAKLEMLKKHKFFGTPFFKQEILVENTVGLILVFVTYGST